jgi:hypothetical protein
VEYIKGMGARTEGYTHLWSTLKGSSHPFNVLHKFVYPSLLAPITLMYSTSLCTLLFQHKLVEYIKGMGARTEGYTHLWSTLKGWELEEKGTQTCGVH